MWTSHVTINFDSEFCVPFDCLGHGTVTCRVIRTHCEVVDCWDGWVTYKVCLLLRITIDSGCGERSFTEEVTLRETASLDAWAKIVDCRVVAAVCRCLLQRGKVHCNGSVKVEFLLNRRHDRWACATGSEMHLACDETDSDLDQSCHRKEPCTMDFSQGFDRCHCKGFFKHPKHFDHREHCHRKKKCECFDHKHFHRHDHFHSCKKRCHKRRHHRFCEFSGSDWSGGRSGGCSGSWSGDWSGGFSGDCSGSSRRRPHRKRRKHDSSFHPVWVHGRHEPGKRFLFS